MSACTKYEYANPSTSTFHKHELSSLKAAMLLIGRYVNISKSSFVPICLFFSRLEYTFLQVSLRVTSRFEDCIDQHGGPAWHHGIGLRLHQYLPDEK